MQPKEKPSTCQGCPLQSMGHGWVEIEGTCENGVLLVGEAPNEHDAEASRPFVGRSGAAFTQLLLRRGIKREHFGIANVIQCQPPFNKLRGQWYEDQAIKHCAPNLQAVIARLKPRVIVALGDTAHRRLIGPTEGILKSRGYVEWAPGAKAWVIGTYHPAFILRGNQRLSGVFLHDIEQALAIAEKGFIPHQALIHADPPFFVAEAWVSAYEEACRKDPDGTWLAYDIETPYKAEQEDEGDLDTADVSYQILRIGFSWKDGEALSIPWTTAYISLIKRLFATSSPKLVWNGRYDNPRLRFNDIIINGPIWDLMWGWHLINSDLPKGLSFVATFLAEGQGRWKHLSKAEPARYNGIDAEVTRRIATRLVGDLKRQGLWEIFLRHIVQLDVILDGMTSSGVLVNDGKRREKAAELGQELEALTAAMQAVVPLAGKRLKTYKGKPKGVEWQLGDPSPEGFTVMAVVASIPFCPACGMQSPPKAHFKVFKKKVNPCGGLEPEMRSIEVPRLARIERFVPSNVQMQAYATLCGHPLIKAKVGKGETPKVTFDDLALQALIRKHPKDPLYPLVRKYRDVEKLAGTYVGTWDEAAGRWVSGPPLGRDGRIHPIFTYVPSTGRLASTGPNAQNIDGRIKDLYVPSKGWRFLEVDYAAIEARIVGYDAGSETYDRLAKLGVHDFLCSHILARDKTIPAPANLSWSDGDLKAFFADLKRRFKPTRDVAKRIVHLSNYGGTPKRIADAYPEEFPSIALAAKMQGLYFEVCPEIKVWQNRVVDQAEDTGYLINPFGYVHRFWAVKQWTKERDGTWQSSWGEDAKKALAFIPQSTASGIIKEAILAIAEECPEWLQYLRLQVHDSLLFEAPPEVFDTLTANVVEIMTRSIPCLPLPWKEGENLAIGVEAKAGGVDDSWKDLKVI